MYYKYFNISFLVYSATTNNQFKFNSIKINENTNKTLTNIKGLDGQKTDKIKNDKKKFNKMGFVGALAQFARMCCGGGFYNNNIPSDSEENSQNIVNNQNSKNGVINNNIITNKNSKNGVSNPNIQLEENISLKKHMLLGNIQLKIENIDISNCESTEEAFNKYKNKYALTTSIKVEENITKYRKVYDYDHTNGSYNHPIIQKISKIETIISSISDINIPIYIYDQVEIYDIITSLEKKKLINSNNIFVLEWKYKLNNMLQIFNESLDIITKFINNQEDNMPIKIQNNLKNKFILMILIDRNIFIFENKNSDNYKQGNIGMMISKIILSNELKKIDINLYYAFCIICLIDMPLSYNTNNKTYISLLLSNNTHLNEINNKYIEFLNIFNMIYNQIYVNSKDSVNPTSEFCEESQRNLLNINRYCHKNEQFSKLLNDFIDQITKKHQNAPERFIVEEKLYNKFYDFVKTASIDNLILYAETSREISKQIYDEIMQL